MEHGGIVMGWLVKIVLAGALVGVVGFDAAALLSARFGLIDQGETAARAASESWQGLRNIQVAYDAAAATAAQANAGNTVDAATFAVSPDGTVRLQITRQVTTLLLHRVSALRRYTVLHETVAARSAA